MSSLNRTRILIVDDEPDMAKIIALMLRKESVETISATGGRQGIDMAFAETPDVIITDLMMPGVDGFSLMERVLEQAPHLPIIVVTAYSSMDAAIRALRLGAFDFLVKPIDPYAVRKAVNRAAQQQLLQKQENWHQLIANALSTSRDPEFIGQKLLSLTAAALGTEHGFLWWSGQDVPTAFLFPEDESLRQPLLGWARDAGVVTTGGKTPACQIAQSIPENVPFKSVIGFPLFTRNHTHCVLILANEQIDYFDESDVAFLHDMAAFVALAVETALTYANLKNSNQRLSTLQSINALTYNAELPLNRILRLAVEGIRQNMGYPAVILCLPDGNNDNLMLRAAGGHLDSFLRRRGDAPTRRITFPISQKEDDAQSPFSRTFTEKRIQDVPIDEWTAALEQVGAADMAQALTQHEIKRCWGLPLWGGERVIGVLVIGHSQDGALSSEENALLTSLTNQISMVVTNASLYQAEQQGRREMEALYRAGLVITSTLSESEVLTAIVQQLVTLTNVESCIIARWDERSDAEVIDLYLQKTPSGWQEKAASGTTLPLAARPLVRQALERQRSHIVSIDSLPGPSVERAWMLDEGVKMRLVMPLVVRNKSIGVIELLTTRANRQFGNNVIRIVQGLAAQAAIAMENARLHEAEIKRIEQEMDLAQRIQINLLPHEPPQIPGLSIAARSVSARLVGGDFYRYLSMPDDKFGVVVGDVSGKGIPSALFMAITITTLDTQVRQLDSPGDMLHRLNQTLYPRMQANGMNTGLLVAVFDVAEKKLEIANAGMIAPLIKQQQEFQWIDVAGFPVGVEPQTSYLGKTLSFGQNATLILASDGILEAKNHRDEMFGFERFQSAVQQIPSSASSQQALDHIWQEAEEYIQDAEPHDDMTLVVVQTE